MASLNWSLTAKIDLKEIYDFIAKDSRYYANSFVNKIKTGVKKLKSYQNMGRIVPEYNKDEIREIIFQNYRIIYHYDTQQIIILTIFHAARELSKYKIDDWEIK